MKLGSKLATLLSLTGLALSMAGCPGGDDSTTGADTGTVPTTGTPMTSSTGEPATSTTDTPMTSGQTGDSGADTSGGVTTDTPPADSSSGEPPAMCGLVVQLNFPNPACGPCAEANCCPQLQACFGDETTMEMTECLQLNNCIAMNCAMAMTQMEFQMCVDANCSDFSASLPVWGNYQMCLGLSCQAECS